MKLIVGTLLFYVVLASVKIAAVVLRALFKWRFLEVVKGVFLERNRSFVHLCVL